MLKLAVCDDETYMLEDIAARISGYMESREIPCQVSRFTSGRELLQSGRPFDLLFLDIQMEAPDGMKTAKIMRSQGFCGILIFITVLRELVFDSFEVEAYDYLLKPIEDSRFLRTMDRAVSVLERKAEKNIIVQKGSECRVVPLEEIMYGEVLGRKIYLHTREGETIDYYCRLAELERSVDSRFFRCHRSYLVNLDCVRGLKGGAIMMSDGSSLPVSRLREPEFTQALLAHMKERRR